MVENEEKRRKLMQIPEGVKKKASGQAGCTEWEEGWLVGWWVGERGRG